ncbi:MAG TPA: PEP-CTERM sorting domain-containing protein [Tepidisphaeraceae bacterium]|jgi:hypothetical protein|nr:PEP-CTERM sorting domain-containing protein [Tepidisphaeraceae bacterium]
MKMYTDRLTIKVPKKIILTAAQVALCIAVGQTRATPITYDYVTDKSSYTAAAGQTVSVKVFLQENLNGNTSIISGHGENGLYGAAFEVLSGSRPSPNPSLMTALTLNTTDFNGGSPTVFVNNPFVSNPNEADGQEQISNGNTMGVPLANQGAPANEVYLGMLTITVGSTPGTTNFSLGEYDVQGNAGYNTITNPDGYDLDGSGTVGTTSYTGVGTMTTPFTVISPPTPEPTSMALLTFGSLAMLARRRHRARQNQQPSDHTPLPSRV